MTFKKMNLKISHQRRSTAVGTRICGAIWKEKERIKLDWKANDLSWKSDV
jgi:hypothetical protein